MSAVRLYDAKKLAERNRAAHTGLEKRQRSLTASNETEMARQNASRAQAAEKVLGPFEEAFSQLRNVDIEELKDLDHTDRLSFSTPELRAIRISAASGVTALATSAAAGAGASAVVTAAVSTFAAASTGTAISSLSGAAATNATLAWLGGGTVASGGGGMAAGATVLTAVAAAPAIAITAAFLHYQGNKALRKQREVAADLKRADGELRTLISQWQAIRTRSKAVREVLDRLVAATEPRVAWLQQRVVADSDYQSFSERERADLAVLVSLVTTSVAVMQADLFDDDMCVTPVSAAVVSAASAQLRAMDAVDV